MRDPHSSRSAGHLVVTNLRLTYMSAGDPQPQKVLDIEHLELPPGSQVAVTGPSGAGKTSLLYVLTGISVPDSGRVEWDEVNLTGLSEGGRDAWRRANVGFIFQEFYLLPGMTVLQNVLLPSSFSQFRPSADLVQHAGELLERVGAPPGGRSIETLSRGEQQRVALARALAHRPKIIVADEPTASLDADNGLRIKELLFDTAAEDGLTLLTVSHDPRLLSAARQVLWLEGGRLVERRGEHVA